MLKLSHISKTFNPGTVNEKVAIRDLSLHLEKGDFATIIGSNGAGKSTMFNAICGDFLTDSGSVVLDGEDITDKPVQKRGIGMVFQQPIAFPHSIEKNLTYVLKYYGIRDKKVLSEKVEESLKKAKLYEEVKDQLKKSALKLSGGQKQRLAIARSLCVNPEILLLDEPCSALDMKNTIAIEETLMELKGQYTFVIVTHNLGQAKRIADQIIFMDQGKILEVTDKETFFDSPATELAREQIQYM